MTPCNFPRYVRRDIDGRNYVTIRYVHCQWLQTNEAFEWFLTLVIQYSFQWTRVHPEATTVLVPELYHWENEEQKSLPKGLKLAKIP